MALIRWKQIDPNLGSYGNLTGSLDISGSLLVNGAEVGAAATTASHAAFAVSASYAISASHEIITELSSSHAQQADTASFITDTFISASAVRGGFGSSESSSYALTASFVDDSIISESAARSGFGAGSDSTTFNGNKVISQAHLPGLFTSSFNAGTTGSVQDFLNAVFFPNTGPSITSATQFNIAEFVASGSTITTLSATDPEAQALTFTTQSGYTDDLIKLSTGGVLTLNVTSSTEQFNTDDRGDGTLAHPVLVQVADTFGGTDTQTIYIESTKQ